MTDTSLATQGTAIPQVHSETIDGTTYEVTSNYVGNIPLLDLFKCMIKRDIQKSED